MVSQDASATVDGLTGFSGLGYDLYDGATLTLGGSTVQTAPVVFAGYGKAVLDVDFNVVGQPAIMRGSLLNRSRCRRNSIGFPSRTGARSR
jgi:hypothetical protein